MGICEGAIILPNRQGKVNECSHNLLVHVRNLKAKAKGMKTVMMEMTEAMWEVTKWISGK